jgi:outer membrane immunogenic protein
LAYVTGGAAWQNYEVSSTCASTSFCVSNDLNPTVVAHTITKGGWTLGAGVETAIWHRWLARAEYRYADFGSAAVTIVRTNATSSTIDNFDVRLRTHTLNFGLAYKFN